MPIIREQDVLTGLHALLAGREPALPAPAAGPPAPPFDVETVLRRRRTTYRFAPGSVSRSELDTVINTARDLFTFAAADFTLLTALHGVSNVHDGLYRHGSTMLPTAGDLLPRLHAYYTAAPVLLFICGPQPGTDYAHRVMGAGAFGHALWLSAISVGLAGSVYGRSAAVITAAAKQLDPGLRHLFTLAIGRSDA